MILKIATHKTVIFSFILPIIFINFFITTEFQAIADAPDDYVDGNYCQQYPQDNRCPEVPGKTSFKVKLNTDKPPMVRVIKGQRQKIQYIEPSLIYDIKFLAVFPPGQSSNFCGKKSLTGFTGAYSPDGKGIINGRWSNTWLSHKEDPPNYECEWNRTIEIPIDTKRQGVRIIQPEDIYTFCQKSNWPSEVQHYTLPRFFFKINQSDGKSNFFNQELKSMEVPLLVYCTTPERPTSNSEKPLKYNP